MRTLALVTYSNRPELSPSDQTLLNPLKQRGIQPIPAIWNDTTIETSLKMTDFITTVETGFGLFPNTRTYLALSASLYYNYYKCKYYFNETCQDSKNNYYEASLNLTGYYYISPKLRLNVRYNYMFSHLIGTNSIQGKYGNQVWYGSYYLPELSILEGENNDKSIYHYFNISLTYSIF